MAIYGASDAIVSSAPYFMNEPYESTICFEYFGYWAFFPQFLTHITILVLPQCNFYLLKGFQLIGVALG